MDRAIQLSLLVAFAQAHGNHGHGGAVSGEDLPWGLAFGLNFAAAVSTLVGAGAVVCNASLRAKLNDPTSPMLVRFLSPPLQPRLFASPMFVSAHLLG